MEDRNIRNILSIVGSDPDRKIYKLLDFTDNPRDISDPWYTRNFNSTFLDLKEGLESFLEKIK